MHTKHWLLTGLLLAMLPTGAWLVSAQAGEAPVRVYVLNASFSDSLQQKIIAGRVDIDPSVEEADILGRAVKLYLSEGEDDSLRFFGAAPLVRIMENGVPQYVYEFRAAGKRGGMVTASVDVPGYGTVRSKRVHNSTYTVTSTANTTDANTADGLCDIDTGTPGSQCTLAAAIAQGNTDNAAGLHTTNFNIDASDTRHYCYMNDGVSGQITIANERTTTTTDDPACGGTSIDPDHPYSWFRIQPPATYFTFSPVYSSATILRTFDGTTQPGARANSAPLFEGYLASDARGAIQKIEITGTGFLADSLSNTSEILFRGVVMNEPGMIFSSYYGMFASANGGFTGLKLKGSYFGTDISGTRDVTTTTCFLGRVGGNNGFAYYGEIGGPNAADRVVVSGFPTNSTCNNAQLTVYRSGGWVVENAFWGTDVTGTQDLGNAGTYQITSSNGCYNYGGDRLTVRSSVISGNDGGAVSVYSCTGDIRNNRIGVNAAGTASLPNGSAVGIYFGSTAAAGRGKIVNNIIGNHTYGIHGYYAYNYDIGGNYIGVTPNGTSVGNTSGGIYLDRASNPLTTVGGETGSGNIVRNNTGVGIRNTYGASGRISMYGNIIYNNSGLGIQSTGTRPTISSATFNGSTVTINGTSGCSTATCRLDFYRNLSSVTGSIDGTNYGEAYQYLGTYTHTTGAFATSIASTATGGYVTATQTTLSSTGVLFVTSEFSTNYSATYTDGSPPTLSSTSPLDNATGVNENTDLVLTFNEAVRPVSGGTVTIKRTSDNSVMDTINVTGGSVTGSGTNTITIDPSFTLALAPQFYAALLSYSTEYYVQISAGAFEDAAGNDYAGLSSTTDWSFTTAADTTAPTLSVTSPVDNATDVSRTASLTLTFNESVAPVGGGTVTIKKTSDNSTVESISVTSGQVTGGGTSSIVVDPSVTLAYSTEYYVQVSAGAFEDLPGNDHAGLSSTTAWSFTTEGDTTPPAVTLLSPLDDAMNVSLSQDFEITFDEDVAAVVGGTIVIRKADNTLVESIAATSGQVTIVGAVVTINPTAPLQQEVNYYVVVSAGAFEDLSGNDHTGIIGNTSWNFRTVSSACNDLLDNDSDGLIDYPSDPGCAGTSDDAESPNDTDGDGISDQDEGEGDADGDGTLDYEETDSDNDGISDEDEYSFEGGFINSCTAR